MGATNSSQKEDRRPRSMRRSISLDYLERFIERRAAEITTSGSGKEQGGVVVSIEKNEIKDGVVLFCAACNVTARVTYRYPNCDLMLDCNHMISADSEESGSLKKNKK